MNVQVSPPKGTQVHSEEGNASPVRKYLIGGAALVVALGGFWYFTNSAEPPARRNVAAPVRIATVEQRTMDVIERTIGTVVANSTVSVNARVTGQLTKAFFREGQMVKTGDPLFQIDPRPYQATYDNALASLASAKAKFDRYTRLKGQNAISPQDVDDAEAAFLEAKATAEAARLNLEFTLIRSPVNGKTGPILIQPGNMITTSSSANASALPLVTINEIQPVKISLSLPQSDLPRIQEMARTKGLSIHMNMDEVGGGKDLTANVDFISNAVTNATGTIEMRATYANDDMALVPGQLVDVTVGLASIPNALVAPREAVNTGPEGTFVYAVRDGAAQQVPVRVLFDDTVHAALQGSLRAGDQVIVDGQIRVIPGSKVNVIGAKSAAAQGDTQTSGGNRAPRKDNEG